MKLHVTLRPYGLVAIVVALAAGSAASHAQAAADERAEVPTFSRDTLVASVNGQPLKQGQFDELLKARAGIANPYDQATPQDEKARSDALANVDRDKVLQDLVVMEVLAQKARERGLHLRPEIAAEAELQYKTLLEQHLVRELIKEVKVTPEEIAARYATQQPERQYKLSHILMKDEASATAAIADLKKGASFEKIAHERTLDKQTKKDGSLGWLMLNQLEQPFEAAARSLKAGEYTSKPVETSYGWHVIRLHESREMKKPSLEDMQGILRTEILHEKVQAQVRQLMHEAKVEIRRGEQAQQGSRTAAQ